MKMTKQKFDSKSAKILNKSVTINISMSRNAKAIQEAQATLDQDLVVVTASDRNWKGIIIAVAVIASILALIVTSIVLLTPPDEGPRVKGRRFELEDIFGQDFLPLRSNGTWVTDKEYLFRDQYGGVSRLDVVTLKTELIIGNYTLGRFGATSFTVSANQKFALFIHDVRKIHRFSFTAQYTVFEIDTRDETHLVIEAHGGHKFTEFELVKWAPVGNSLVLVHQGDIYYKSNPKDRTAHRLTSTGAPGLVTNGVPDWLYEEEVFASNTALWFSKDGQNLLYLSFNDSLVGEYNLLEYGNPDDAYAYPKVKTIKYPKSGTENPIVTATVCDLRSGNKRQRQLKPPERIASIDHYISSAGWSTNIEVSIVWTTRSYNSSVVSICSSINGNCNEEYRVTSERNGWVNAIPFPIFSTAHSGRYFITIAPIRDGDKGLFDQLILVDATNKRSHPLSHGTYEVVGISGWDEERKLVYFLAIPSEHPNQRHLYRVKVEQPYTEHFPECLSCSFDRGVLTREILTKNGTITKETYRSGVVGAEQVWTFPQKNETLPDPLIPTVPTPSVILREGILSSNTSCSFVTKIKFSPNKSWFVLECGGPCIPYTALYSVGEAPESNVRLIQILQNNDELVNRSLQMAFPQTRIFSVNLSQGLTVQVRLSLPPGLREDEITKYPMILHVYGGPGTQLVTDRWGVDYVTYLASKKEYIVAQIDARGSGGRGWKYKHSVYYDLGNIETQDQMEVVKYLRDSLPYVETNKIGIWGWSYGGYLTAHIMTNKDKINLFPCGAAVAPVIQWNLYDSAYTERYMGTPNVTDNFKGYSTSDITRNVEPFVENKMFYLIHGTADDNVHVQHSFLLAKALISKKILFRQQIYPDEKHSLDGAKVHVHRSIEEFFDDCFKKQIIPDVGVGLNKGGKFDDFD